ASDDASFFPGGLSGRLFRSARRKEAIAAAVQRLDEARLVGVVVQRLAGFQHRALEHTFGDVDIGPHRIQQFLFGDQPALPLGEVEQDGESLWRQRDLVRAAPQALVERIEPEGRELMSLWRHYTVTPSSPPNHDSRGLLALF